MLLSKINEAAIVDNLRKRLMDDTIYVGANGGVLVVLMGVF